MLYVLSRSVGQSRAAGLASALGLGLGGVLLAIATAMGLAAIFAAFDWMVLLLRYIGSVYLVWLGYSMIRDAYASEGIFFEAQAVDRKTILTVIWQGIMIEALNPKTVLFFTLFLPPFVDISSGGQVSGSTVHMQLLILGILVPLTAIPADLLIAFAGGTMAMMINRKKSLHKFLAWSGGLVLIGIAVNLHVEIL